MPHDDQSAYDLLRAHTKETALLQSINDLLQWDERTLLPPAGGAFRADQITLLSGMVHRRQTDPRIGEWLDQLADSPLSTDTHSDSGTTIRQLRRRYEKLVKLPQSLVEELTRTAVIGQQTWEKARPANDFAAFRPVLEKTVKLKRQEAECLGYPECPYDALLDEFEPDESTSNVTRVLGALREELVPLVAAIRDSGREPRRELLAQRFPIDAQASFGRAAAEQIGFDFSRGRLDVTAHPFCSGTGPDDCRITTRYHERQFGSALFSILHEAGHGIYDQGLRGDQFGLPPGEAISLAIHESQSRMWENQVGRSRAFWEHLYPAAQRAFPDALSGVSLHEFYWAVNDVRPSLIRVEADEATYNLHILVRFELEQALINDGFSVADLPAAWNECYAKYLGITPPDDADGVLQDVHWSAGLFGYFATYSLGNLYASQFFAAADEALGGLDGAFRRGEFQTLREWLRDHIHRPGQRYTATQLVERVTGKPLSHGPLIAHLKNKLGPLYGVGWE